MRVPPAQSTTRAAARVSAWSGSRERSSGVSRVRRVPNAKTSTPRPERTVAWRKSRSARV
jgi:hypothetical protein